MQVAASSVGLADAQNQKRIAISSMYFIQSVERRRECMQIVFVLPSNKYTHDFFWFQ